MFKTLTKAFLVILITYLIFKAGIAIAVAPDRTIEDYSVQELIAHFADEYNVSAERMSATIKCESNYITDVQSKHKYTFTNAEKGIYKGEQELSFGLVQIHLPSHPHITKAQAIDPVFAVEFMAKAFSTGQQSMWTCYTKLY